jgi:hypothetical protein
MPPEHQHPTAKLLEAVIDALGVIDGPTRTHVSAVAHGRDGTPGGWSRTLCGRAAGHVRARGSADTVGQICQFCMNDAESLIALVGELPFVIPHEPADADAHGRESDPSR